MDDLRIALLIVGIVVVVGVYVFARLSRRHAARKEDEPESIARDPPRKSGVASDRRSPRGKGRDSHDRGASHGKGRDSPDRGAPPGKGGDSHDRGASHGQSGDSHDRSTRPGSRPVKRTTRARREVGELDGMFVARRESSGAERSVDVSILAGLRATYETTMDGTLGGVSEAALDPPPRSGIPDPSPGLPPDSLSEHFLDDSSGGVSGGASDRPGGGDPGRSLDLPPDDASERSLDHPSGGTLEGAVDRPSGGVSERFPDRPRGHTLEDARDSSLDRPLDGDSEGPPDHPPDHPLVGDSRASPGRSADGVPEDPRSHPSGAASEAPRDHALEDASSGPAEVSPPTVPPTSPLSRGAGGPLSVDMSRPLVYLTLVSKQEPLSGRVVLDTLDAEGFRPGLLQLYYWRSEAEPSVKFGVANMVEPGVLDSDALPETETPGLVPFMSVPRDSASAFRILDTMVAVSRRLARRLDARLCDDTRSTLTAQAENHLREKIAEILRRDRI